METQSIDDLSATVKALQERVTALDYELRAWQMRAHKYCPRCGGPSVQSKPINVPFASLPLTDAVMMVVSEKDSPIAIRKLRIILEEKGMKEKMGRYGNNMRTAITRLVKAGRLLREGDAVEMLK
ncbi:MAG: hypothetical protein QM771_03915 [Nitrospira sp.]